jgi:hypothetical protein
VGGAVIGRKNWKTEDGRTYAAWQEEKLTKAGAIPKAEDADEI